MMRRRLYLKFAIPAIFCCAGLALPPRAARAASDAEVAAHRQVLDVAGAFTNDGFKIRDGLFTGALKGQEAALVQVNLYAGNQYWFSAATDDAGGNIAIAVYDENGQPVKTDPYADAGPLTPGYQAKPATNTSRVAAGFAPEVSGPYYVRVQDTSADAAKPETFCLIYSYK